MAKSELWRAKWDHGVPAERFLQYGSHIGQLRLVSKVGQTIFAHY